MLGEASVVTYICLHQEPAGLASVGWPPQEHGRTAAIITIPQQPSRLS